MPPWDYTWRELDVMADAKSRRMWEMAAQAMAVMANCAFGSRGGFKAEDFDPYEALDKAKMETMPLREFFGILNGAAAQR